jgi:hypothetical protein
MFGHTLQGVMAAEPSCVTAQVDCQNAIKTLCRDEMLAAVKQRCLALLPMVAWVYGRHSRHPMHHLPGLMVHSL